MMRGPGVKRKMRMLGAGGWRAFVWRAKIV